MSVLLHPNKQNPQRYRVWDRETRTQKYFPLTEKGKRDAERFDQKVAKVKKARALSRELGINKLFNEDGSVKGLRRNLRERKGRDAYECFNLYAKGRYTEISLKARSFEEAYDMAKAWLLEQHQVEDSMEIRQKFKKAKRLYHRSVKEKSDKTDSLFARLFDLT